jgi:hypothetical protein
MCPYGLMTESGVSHWFVVLYVDFLFRIDDMLRSDWVKLKKKWKREEREREAKGFRSGWLAARPALALLAGACDDVANYVQPLRLV